MLLTAGAGTVGAGALVAVADEVKHGYAATERTARVASTLFTCINEWVSSKNFDMGNAADIVFAATG